MPYFVDLDLETGAHKRGAFCTFPRNLVREAMALPGVKELFDRRARDDGCEIRCLGEHKTPCVDYAKKKNGAGRGGDANCY